VEGKPAANATDYVGAIRVKATDKLPFLGAVNDKEILFGLKVAAEPKLTIQQIASVRIDKAVDDQDQKLAQAMADPANDVRGPANLPVAPRRGVWGPGGINAGGNHIVPVRLKKGDKASKSLKELTGVLSAQVLAPAAPAITVEKIMEAAGKNVKGAEGGEIRVKEVTKNPNGQITIKFELDPTPGVVPANPNVIGLPPGIGGPVPVPLPAPVPLPPGVLPPNPAPNPAPGKGFAVQQAAQAQPGIQIQIQAQPGVIVVGQGGVGNATTATYVGNASGVSLQDEKGNDIQVVGTRQSIRKDAKGIVREQEMIFQPAKDQVPAKLVFSGSKPVAIDIPFSLKNVTLP